MHLVKDSKTLCLIDMLIGFLQNLAFSSSQLQVDRTEPEPAPHPARATEAVGEVILGELRGSMGLFYGLWRRMLYTDIRNL